ncbi:MAG: hypothetical protein AAFW01_04375 [Pseudomonadota bacterium]
MTRSLTTPFLVAFIMLGSAHGATAQSANRDQVIENFMQADANTDGALTLSEFTTLIDLNAQSGIGRAAMIKRLGRYGTAFGRLDGDGDGVVTAEELQALAQRAQR